MTNKFPDPTKSPPAAQVVPSPEPSGDADKAPKAKELAKAHRGMAIEALAEILDKGSDSNKIRAAEILLGYSDGKPKQETETTITRSFQDFLSLIPLREQKYLEAASPDVVSDVEVIELKSPENLSRGLAKTVAEQEVKTIVARADTPKINLWADI